MMGEEFYCILKLISGEEIFSLIYVDENEENPVIVLNKPIIIKEFTTSEGYYLKVKPWMELTDEDIFFIKLDKVITMTESTDKKLISIYNKFISGEENNEEYTESGKVSVTENMGYISSVEKARKSLEDLFKDKKES